MFFVLVDPFFPIRFTIVLPKIPRSRRRLHLLAQFRIGDILAVSEHCPTYTVPCLHGDCWVNEVNDMCKTMTGAWLNYWSHGWWKEVVCPQKFMTCQLRKEFITCFFLWSVYKWLCDDSGRKEYFSCKKLQPASHNSLHKLSRSTSCVLYSVVLWVPIVQIKWHIRVTCGTQ